jgi:hypothetical protein
MHSRRILMHTGPSGGKACKSAEHHEKHLGSRTLDHGGQLSRRYMAAKRGSHAVIAA